MRRLPANRNKLRIAPGGTTIARRNKQTEQKGQHHEDIISPIGGPPGACLRRVHHHDTAPARLHGGARRQLLHLHRLGQCFDNLELRTSEVPSLSIERTVRLVWPPVPGNWIVDDAPTPQGVWMPVPDTTPPGWNQMTVSAGEWMQFYLLRQGP